jgi:hypothetical protein
MQEVDAFVKETLETLGVTVKRLKYKGQAKTYIEYMLVVCQDISFSDDEADATEYNYRADIYSKNNYMELLAQIKQTLKAAGFSDIVVNPETFENDTGYYHIPVDFKYYTFTEE